MKRIGDKYVLAGMLNYITF